MDFIKKGPKEIIRIFDLRLRWKGALGKEIVELNRSGRLPSFWIEKETISGVYISPYQLKYNEEFGYCDTWINGTQPKCAFLLDDVERIEKEHPDFMEERLDRRINFNSTESELGEVIESVIIEEMRLEYENKIKELKKQIEELKAAHEEEEATGGKGLTKYFKLIAVLLAGKGITGYEPGDDTVGKIKAIMEKGGRPLTEQPIREICIQLNKKGYW